MLSSSQVVEFPRKNCGLDHYLHGGDAKPVFELRDADLHVLEAVVLALVLGDRLRVRLQRVLDVLQVRAGEFGCFLLNGRLLG